MADHMHGMFAFALWDEEEQKLFCLRDQFGTKPFYYYETEDGELLYGTMIRDIIDRPGFKKDEITAELKDGYLTISAAKGLDKDEKDKEGKYIRRERYAGNMSRSFYVGKDITEKDIHGKYENGILMLDIPKKAPEKKVEEKKFVTIEG